VLATPILFLNRPSDLPTLEAGVAIEGKLITALCVGGAAIELLVEVPMLRCIEVAIVLLRWTTLVPVQAAPILLVIRPPKLPIIIPSLAIVSKQLASLLRSVAAVNLLVDVPLLCVAHVAIMLVVRATFVSVITTPLLLVLRPTDLPTFISCSTVEGQLVATLVGDVTTVQLLLQSPRVWRIHITIVLIIQTSFVSVVAAPILLFVCPGDLPIVIAIVAIEGQLVATLLSTFATKQLLVQIPCVWRGMVAIVLMIRAPFVLATATPLFLLIGPTDLPPVEARAAVVGKAVAPLLLVLAAVDLLLQVPIPGRFKAAIVLVLRATFFSVCAAPIFFFFRPADLPTVEPSVAIIGKLVATLLIVVTAVDLLLDVPITRITRVAIMLIHWAGSLSVRAAPHLLLARPANLPLVEACGAVVGQLVAAF